MTPKEAIDIINDVTWEDNSRHYGKTPEARNKAVAALEKQIPKKITESVCPSCNRIFLFRHGEKRKGDYCDNCGQAIDWSDTEC